LGLLAEILPEVTNLKGVAQSKPHRWDVFEHTLQTASALEALLPFDGSPSHPDVPFADRVTEHLSIKVAGGHTRRLLLAVAALLHDVGKPDTAATEPSGRIRFIGHERVGARIADQAMHRLRFSREAILRVETIVRHHLRPLQLAWQGSVGKRTVHRFFRDVGDIGVDIALLSIADHTATIGLDIQDERYDTLLQTVTTLLDTYFNQHEKTISPPSLLNGHDLVQRFKVAQGLDIGRLLTDLQEAQATDQVTNRQQAEAWVRRRMREWGLETQD
jgi:putative nucleotidyltransferase with HDIG domain